MNTAADTDIEFSSRVVRSEAIEFAELDDTIVMMDVDEGRYYELNPVGARVWALIESGPRVTEVCEALAAEYEVRPDTCRSEVGAFFAELRRLAVVCERRPDDVKAATVRTTLPAGERLPEESERSGGVQRGKLAWSTPTVRTMAMARTQSGTVDNTVGDWVDPGGGASYLLVS